MRDASRGPLAEAIKLATSDIPVPGNSDAEDVVEETCDAEHWRHGQESPKVIRITASIKDASCGPLVMANKSAIWDIRVVHTVAVHAVGGASASIFPPATDGDGVADIITDCWQAMPLPDVYAVNGDASRDGAFCTAAMAIVPSLFVTPQATRKEAHCRMETRLGNGTSTGVQPADEETTDVEATCVETAGMETTGAEAAGEATGVETAGEPEAALEATDEETTGVVEAAGRETTGVHEAA